MPLLASSNFLVPNLTFVFELIAFLIVLFVLGKYVLPVLQRSLEERQENVRKGILDAEEAKQRLAKTEADYQEAMDQARTEARAMVDEARRLGSQAQAEARRRGEEEAARIVAGARAEIEASARRATEDLRREVTGLVVSVVEKVVGEGLDTRAHHDLIDRTIAEVEEAAAGSPAAASTP